MDKQSEVVFETSFFNSLFKSLPMRKPCKAFKRNKKMVNNVPASLFSEELRMAALNKPLCRIQIHQQLKCCVCFIYTI